MTEAAASVKGNIRRELLRIEEDCIYSSKTQFNAAVRCTAQQFRLGLPAVILSALASTVLFAKEPVLGGLLAAAVTILTSLQTFLKPSERAAAHKGAGDQYLRLKNDARVFREIKLDHTCDDQAAIDALDEFTKRRNELNQGSLQCSTADFQKAKEGIKEGEGYHSVDKKG